jgi:hypothetical protein
MLIDNQLRLDRAIAEVPRLSKQICLNLTRTLAKYPIGSRMPRKIENKCMVICTTSLLWDIFALMDPKSIRVSLFKLLQMKFFFKGYYCPCGMTFGDQ